MTSQSEADKTTNPAKSAVEASVAKADLSLASSDVNEIRQTAVLEKAKVEKLAREFAAKVESKKKF